MRKKSSFIIILFLVLLSWASARNLTVYNSGYALYGEEVRFEMKKGVHIYSLPEVPETLDTGSITIYPLDNKGIVVYEQNYDYDLINSSQLFKKQLGKKITVVTLKGDEIRGTLLNYDGSSLLLDVQGEIQSIRGDQIFRFSFEKSGEIMVRPTLSWMMKSPVQGREKFRLSYLLNGMRWSAKYNLILNDDETEGILNSWITMTNESGKEFTDVRLQLMAGDVQRLTENRPVSRLKGMGMVEEMAMADTEVSEEGMMEYHLYSIARDVSIAPRQKKEIPFFSPLSIKTEKRLKYMIAEYNKKVNVTVEFMNTKENAMGMALPAGILSVYKNDSSGNLQFVGNDRISHTPKNERISVRIGDSFDILGEAVVLKREKVRKDTYDIQYQVMLKNRKESKETVYASYHRSPREKLIQYEIKPKSEDAREIVFAVPLNPDEERTFTFTVRTQY
ncbi:MAG TPA: hypothetical protein PLF44_04855 [Candidatus Mcinerneyibacteriales bacterium]|nr:hypothetical protein [Candidatus Mcinerneyibacteriota bacterium]HPE20103.1 hypothetical protein [Candidatus Mcinerneyibacteriales bacterium]HPJ70190.1 hypothetical protein [Candidatus Mcinerneyibacteriales bacterium]